MPRYKVLEKSYINNRIVEAGEEVDYDGLPSGNLEPLDKAGQKAAAEYETSNAERVATMIAQNAPTPSVDAQAIAAAVAEGVATGLAQQAT
jgi:hypothetical protein